jgi:DME family drug/metabolite transporter
MAESTEGLEPVVEERPPLGYAAIGASARTWARLYLIIAAVGWSTSGLLLKSLPGVHWLAIAGVRSAFGSLLFVRGFSRPRPPLAKLIPAMLLYLFLVSTLMGSMQLGTAAQGIWLQYIAPAVVALWVWRVQKQRLRPAETLAVALTIVAVGFIATGGSGAAHRQSVLLGVLSGFGFGFFILLLKSLEAVPPASIFLWTNLCTAGVLLPVLAITGVPLPTSAHDLGLLAIMGLGQLCLPYYFFQRGLAHTAPVAASLIALLEPILNPIWVYLVIGEAPSHRVIAGCVLIGVGLVAFALTANNKDVRG